jgi:zinc/manganese transport system substrate-binding protein
MVAIAMLMGVAGLGGCGDDSGADRPERPRVVATFAPIGAIVAELVGPAADVTVLVPNGQDPHEYEPSAKDVERIGEASLVVANGLDLEEGLVEVIEQAAADGVATFMVTDYVRLLVAADPDEHGPDDPHVWTDPATMAEMVPALADALEAALGVDLSAGEAGVLASLADDDAAIRQSLSVLAPGTCQLVTGHESLAYFAERYGCEVVGTVVPGLSSTAEASALHVADLRELVERTGVAAVFTEVGTPDDVVRQLADETGVAVVELPSHGLDDESDYSTLVRTIAERIAEGLTGS